MQGSGAKQPKPLLGKNHLPMVFTQGINRISGIKALKCNGIFFKEFKRVFLPDRIT